MGFLTFFLGEKKPTASVAKERLQLILAHERSGRNAAAPDYLPQLKAELIAVISKYVQVDPSHASSRTTSRCWRSRSSCPTRADPFLTLFWAASGRPFGDKHLATHPRLHSRTCPQFR